MGCGFVRVGFFGRGELAWIPHLWGVEIGAANPVLAGVPAGWRFVPGAGSAGDGQRVPPPVPVAEPTACRDRVTECRPGRADPYSAPPGALPYAAYLEIQNRLNPSGAVFGRGEAGGACERSAELAQDRGGPTAGERRDGPRGAGNGLGDGGERGGAVEFRRRVESVYTVRRAMGTGSLIDMTV